MGNSGLYRLPTRPPQGIDPLSETLIALPYFPICPDHNLFDALDMLYDTYRKLLEEYRPGKIYLSSPGSALEPEERKTAEKLNKSDLIMSTTALDNIFAGMAGGKELPEYLSYNQRGIYTGIRDVYLTYGTDEVFSAAAESTAERLRSFGAVVKLEIGESMYHAYSVMPLIPEAKPAYERMIQYLEV